MKPSLITVMLEKCAQTVEQVLIPNLTDAFAVEEAVNAANVLHLLAPYVEEKGAELIEENERIRDVLRRVVDVLQKDSALSGDTVGSRLIDRLGHDLKKDGVEPPDTIEENHMLKQALAETINDLDKLTKTVPVETISSLRQQIRSALRAQIDREMAHVNAQIGQLQVPLEQVDNG